MEVKTIKTEIERVVNAGIEGANLDAKIDGWDGNSLFIKFDKYDDAFVIMSQTPKLFHIKTMTIDNQSKTLIMFFTNV